MFEAKPSAPVCALGHLPLAGEVESQNLQWIQNPDVPTMALRDGPMCDAKLVPWESYFVTLRVRPLQVCRNIGGGSGLRGLYHLTSFIWTDYTIFFYACRPFFVCSLHAAGTNGRLLGLCAFLLRPFINIRVIFFEKRYRKTEIFQNFFRVGIILTFFCFCEHRGG